MRAKIVVGLLLLVIVALSGFLYLVARESGDPHTYAIVQMAWGLIVLWVFLGGGVMFLCRDRVRAFVQGIPGDWRVTFVLFATGLALIEEAITVSLSNLAPFFGSTIGKAAITASTNYLDVVLFHSVVVFIPFFIAWAAVLSRYEFSPFAVFLCFGIMGIAAEATLVGPGVALLGFAQWIFVYGLMIYLPTYCIPRNRGARQTRVMHHVLVIPAVFVLAMPILVPVVWYISVFLGHPSIH